MTEHYPFSYVQNTMELEPIENFVLTGFLKRYQSVFFKCPVIWAGTEDKILALKRYLGTDSLSYPYAFLTLDSIGYDSDAGLNNSSIGRRGVPVVVNESNTLVQKVRLMSAKFTINCEFVTNELKQAKEYTKLWLFAYRFGHLKFNIKYGKLSSVRCNVELDESTSIPVRESKADGLSDYTITSSAIIHGYISKSRVETKPLLHDLRVVSTEKSKATPVWSQTWTIPPRKGIK